MQKNNKRIENNQQKNSTSHILKVTNRGKIATAKRKHSKEKGKLQDVLNNYNKGNTNSTRHWRQNELTTPNRKTTKTKSMQITTHSTKRNQDLPTEIYNAEIDDTEINDTERDDI
ncbi:8048_t:CDS:2 [Racocetra persica]|uniref:8048_t:CDS:1 n=1 Tax=Racocetra persica TaxID=160502 RepID=A0ACA9PR88_9GLOM|nr:8048_t:CDS:2 [Racocetra persica]